MWKPCEPENATVCLVMAPTATFNQPSLALGILKSCLLQADISCYVDYATAYFCYELGQEHFEYLFGEKNTDILEEYLFAELAGLTPKMSLADVVKELSAPEDIIDQLKVEKEILRALKIAKKSIQHTVDRLLSRNPSVIGCSITFRQLNASMAILKRVKELAPDIVTIIGGSRCAEESGIAIMETFSFVDYVFFGESDEIFAQTISHIIKKQIDNLPFGVVKNQPPYPTCIPYRITKDLNAIPYPNYDDFFDLLSLPQGKAITESSKEKTIILSAEMSRGCWWGEKKPCTFCGLNGSHNCYRRKDARRILEELKYLFNRYGVSHVQFTDCILPPKILEELEEILSAEPFEHEFYAEVRSNISEQIMHRYHSLGFYRMQPGIESLSDEHLKLMNKGVTAIQNIYTMKLARQYDIDFVWNLLVAFPGESVSAYKQQMDRIPLIEHLMPPTGVREVIFAKNSVYYREPEKFGLRLKPASKYSFFASDPSYIEKIALDFESTESYRSSACVEEENHLNSCVRKWKKEFKKDWQSRSKQYYGLVRLDMEVVENRVIITDTRSIRKRRNYVFSGIQKELLNICNKPVSFKQITDFISADEETIKEVLLELMDFYLILEINGQYLSLAVPETHEICSASSITEFLLDTDYRDKFQSLSELVAAAEKAGYWFNLEDLQRLKVIPISV